MHTDEILKQEAIMFIQNHPYKHDTIESLWGLLKYWAEKFGYEIGGAYHSEGTSAQVHLLIGESKYSFEISLSEVKRKKHDCYLCTI